MSDPVLAGDARAESADDVPAVRRLADWDAAGLRALAEEYGTPLYVLDVDRALANVRRLRAAFDRPDRPVDVHYAVKANATPNLLSALAEAGAGAECASAVEVDRALAAGVPAERLRYTAVNPPARDLDAICERWRDGADVAVTAGARDTVERLADRDYEGRLLVRVAPQSARATTRRSPSATTRRSASRRIRRPTCSERPRTWGWTRSAFTPTSARASPTRPRTWRRTAGWSSD